MPFLNKPAQSRTMCTVWPLSYVLVDDVVRFDRYYFFILKRTETEIALFFSSASGEMVPFVLLVALSTASPEFRDMSISTQDGSRPIEAQRDRGDFFQPTVRTRV